MHFWIALEIILVEKLVRSQLNSQTCMRAVNRQPMFTARGTRRAFSFSIYVSCSIERILRYNKDS